jgi:hypothetical protein
MMQKLNFPDKWLTWTNEILSSTQSVILLNGIPRKSFNCKRGVRQGDPLSPLLFVLAAELLQHILNEAARIGLLKHPLDLPHTSDFPIVQYADDTILVLEASQRQLFCLKEILQTFSQLTGLQVNHSKSCLLPINISNEKASQMAGVFGC